MACLLWLAFASSSLVLMAKEIKITLDGRPCAFREILLLPYRHRPDSHLPTVTAEPFTDEQVSYFNNNSPVQEIAMPQSHGVSLENQTQPYTRRPGTVHSDVTALNSPSFSPPYARSKFREDLTILPDTPRTAVGIPERSFTVTITMRYQSGWQWYETGIETMAVGVYLYATIVLGSILFLTGQSSIEYVVMLVLSLAVIRIVGTVL